MNEQEHAKPLWLQQLREQRTEQDINCWCKRSHRCTKEGCAGVIVLNASEWICDECGHEYGEDWTNENGCAWGWYD